MRPRPIIDGDTMSYEAHTCIVFTANGSGAQLMPMVTRTVTTEDNSALGCFDRCVDLATTYGAEVRKTRSRTFKHDLEASYLVFYNLSSKLPENQTLARLVDTNVNNTPRLFWRGDVVVMRADISLDPHVQCLDASLSDIASIQDPLLREYSSGRLEEDLSWDEMLWNMCCKDYQSWLRYRRKAKAFWGANFKQREVESLNDINELRMLLGHPALSPHPYMGSTLSLVTSAISSWMPSLVPTSITGAPKLDPDTERMIFEMCARNYPPMCPTLVLVAQRVKSWVDPILYQVIDLNDSGERQMSNHRVELFHSNNLLKPGLPPCFYALHVKSLWVPPMFGDLRGGNVCDQILAACSGVENLVIFTPTSFLESPDAGLQLRRLTTTVTNFCLYAPDYTLKVWPFDHTCFANLTHLHLYDDNYDWPTYRGWENLRSLTHLALACAAPENVAGLWKKLPRLSYVALGHFESGKGRTTINNAPHMLAAWPKRVVWLSYLTRNDWMSGARGGEDMWTLVEREVARRLAHGL